MEDSRMPAYYKILINPAEEILCAFATYLFNQPFHVKQQPCPNSYIFYLFHTQKKQAYARFSLFIEEKKGVSPCRATFGSIEINPTLPHQLLDHFIETIDRFAIEQALEEIYIKSYPFCYAPEIASQLTASLLRHAYQLSQTELNYHIPITDAPFEAQLHTSERRKLKKCMENKFSFREELQPELPIIYEMIRDSRIRRAFPVTLSYNDFEQLFIRFPGIYQVFTIKDGQAIIALTVTARINAHILYNFYPADDPRYRVYSPTVLLMKGIYEYCQQYKFSLFDLGIATDQGEPNYGLMRFKQFLGAKPSLKLSFSKYF